MSATMFLPRAPPAFELQEPSEDYFPLYSLIIESLEAIFTPTADRANAHRFTLPEPYNRDFSEVHTVLEASQKKILLKLQRSNSTVEVHTVKTAGEYSNVAAKLGIDEGAFYHFTFQSACKRGWISEGWKVGFRNAVGVVRGPVAGQYAIHLQERSKTNGLLHDTSVNFRSFRHFILATGVSQCNKYYLSKITLKSPDDTVYQYDMFRNAKIHLAIESSGYQQSWILLSAGFGKQFTESFSAYVREEESFGLDVTLRAHVLHYLRSTIVVEKQHSWDHICDVTGLDAEVTKTFHNSFHDLPLYYDLSNPILIIVNYIAMMENTLNGSQQGLNEEARESVTINGQSLPISTMKMVFKTEKDIESNAKGNLEIALAEIYPQDMHPTDELWYHGCTDENFRWMVRNGISCTALHDEPRSLDADKGFYFTKNIQHAIFRSLRSFQDCSYVLTAKVSKVRYDELATSHELCDLSGADDYPRLIEAIKYNRSEYHALKGRNVQPLNDPIEKSAKWIRGFVSHRVKPAVPSTESLLLETVSASNTPATYYLQPDVEQLCFREDKILHEFIRDGGGILKIACSAPLKILRTWAGKRAYSANLLKGWVKLTKMQPGETVDGNSDTRPSRDS